MFQIESGDFQGAHFFFERQQDHRLGAIVVCHGEDGIVTFGIW